jgi:hypothetical protein
VQKAGGNLSPPTNRAGRLKTKPAPEELLKLIAKEACFSGEEKEKFLRPIVGSFLDSSKTGGEDRFLESLDETLDDFIAKGEISIAFRIFFQFSEKLSYPG